MKKIFLALLSVMMLMGYSEGFAAEKEDAEFKTSFDILKTFGILSEYDDATIEPGKTVSRAEFADTLAEVLKLDNHDYTKMYYHDVPKTHYAYQSITALTEMGYMGGVGNDMFSPDDAILNIHGAKVLMYAMGYDYKIKNSSNPESECYITANKLGIGDGISLGAPMTVRDMVVIMKNALVAPGVERRISGTDIEYEQSEDEALLARVYDCRYVENQRVTGANGVTIYNESLADNYLKIADDFYINSCGNMEDYIGSYVDYIYKGDPDDGDCEVVWISKNQKYEEYDIEISNYDTFDAKNYKFRYYNEQGKARNIEISRNVTVIYNGGFVSNVEDVLNLKNCRARFIENAEDVCDVVVISDYTNFIIGSVNVEEEFIRSKIDNSTISLDKNNYTYYELVDAMGTAYPAGNLKAGDVISVYKSPDGKNIRMVVSDAVVSGVISGKGIDDDDMGYITVNSVRYKLHKDASSDLYDLNASVKLSLDAKGKVAYIQAEISSPDAMYILKVSTNEDSDIENIMIKAYNKDGKIVNYNGAAKISINGVQYRKGIDEYTLKNIKNEISEKIAICEFDSDGNIKNIETPRAGGDIILTDPLGSKYYRAVSGKLGKTACIDGSTIIFGIPNNAMTATEDRFAVLNKGKLGDWKTFNAESYQFKGNSDGIDDIVLIKGYMASSSNDTTAMFVLKSTATTVNKDGEIITVLRGFAGKTEKEYYCDDEFEPEGINPGDILKVEINSKNEVTNIVAKYNKDSAGGESTSSLAAEQRIVIGNVNEIKGDIIKLGYNDTSVIDEIFQIGNTPVIVVDTDDVRNPVKDGSIADINVGGVSKAIVQTYQMNQLLIVIYN